MSYSSATDLSNEEEDPFCLTMAVHIRSAKVKIFFSAYIKQNCLSHSRFC